MPFPPLAFASLPGGVEWLVIGLVALLLFGKRLPGLARSLGQSLTEFKSGLAGGGGEGKPPEPGPPGDHS
ncbi:MAG: twin-arginine translocase TatA/TatE family subunit [Planctomycetota bacterium]|jgi:sec-independent protein translocase protein TatA|nr:twin-arginine translocase TatA/TatE family subunit [Planctomycetota bacterium]